MLSADAGGVAQWSRGAGADAVRVARAAPCRPYALCRLLPAGTAPTAPHTHPPNLFISSFQLSGETNQLTYLVIFYISAKEKLDLLSQSQFPTDAALDELSCADNNSSYEEASCAPQTDTYVITPARARTYLVLDALHDRVSTILEAQAPSPEVLALLLHCEPRVQSRGTVYGVH